jgi:hypothetical protein
MGTIGFGEGGGLFHIGMNVVDLAMRNMLHA